MFKNIKARTSQCRTRMFNGWQGGKSRILATLNLGAMIAMVVIGVVMQWIGVATIAAYSVIFALIMAHFIKLVSLLIRDGIKSYKQPQRQCRVWIDAALVVVLVTAIIGLYQWATSQFESFALDVDVAVWVAILAPMTIAFVEGCTERLHKEN